MNIKDTKEKAKGQTWTLETSKPGDPLRYANGKGHYVRTKIQIGKDGAIICLEDGEVFNGRETYAWSYDKRGRVKESEE